MFGVIEKKSTLKDSGYLERDGNLEKFKKLIPLLEGFNSIHWGGASGTFDV